MWIQICNDRLTMARISLERLPINAGDVVDHEEQLEVPFTASDRVFLCQEDVALDEPHSVQVGDDVLTTEPGAYPEAEPVELIWEEWVET